MAKVYDVPADILINRLAEILKNEDIPAPEWTQFVKTGTHAEKPPQNSDWWHVRCASILRKFTFTVQSQLMNYVPYMVVVDQLVMALHTTKMLAVQL